jgi:Na+/H+-dicarboxylate symporter
MKASKNSLLGVLAAIVLAVFVGSWVGQTGGVGSFTFYSLFDVAGTLFLNALTLVVVPLVSASIITGIARIGSEEQFGRLGLKTFGFYLGTSLLAILIGLFFVNVIRPGSGEEEIAKWAAHGSHEALAAESGGLLQVVLRIIPTDVIDAFSHERMLSLIFFSLLFGYALSKLDTQASSTLLSFWQGVFQAMLKITQIIMRFLPYGVFFLVAKVFATTGIGSLAAVAKFALAVILGLAVFMFIGLPLLLKFVGRVSPLRHFKAMGPALLTAFSTSSSSATLPVTIECVEKRAGVSNRICSLVVPLGTSINMSGSALYECVAAMFVAQAYGVDLSFGMQFLLVFMALITSIGVAGIPSGSLVAIIVILRAIGLPVEGIGLFLAVDRLLDMCRTTVNVFSDSVCAILVAKTEGEKGVLATEPEGLI